MSKGCLPRVRSLTVCQEEEMRLEDLEEFKGYMEAHHEMMSLGRQVLRSKVLSQKVRDAVKRELQMATNTHAVVMGKLSDGGHK